MAAMALGMAYRIALSLGSAPTSFAPHLREKYMANLATVLAHGCCGCAALALGILQFMPRLRKMYPRAHAALGSAYAISVLVSATAALPMAARAYGGWSAKLGLLLLACGWLGTLAVAVARIVAGSIETHGRWMLRNYALTFSAVMVRVWMTAGFSTDLSVETVYQVVAWISWVPTVLAVEVYLARGWVLGSNKLRALQGSQRTL